MEVPEDFAAAFSFQHQDLTLIDYKGIYPFTLAKLTRFLNKNEDIYFLVCHKYGMDDPVFMGFSQEKLYYRYYNYYDGDELEFSYDKSFDILEIDKASDLELEKKVKKFFSINPYNPHRYKVRKDTQNAMFFEFERKFQQLFANSFVNHISQITDVIPITEDERFSLNLDGRRYIDIIEGNLRSGNIFEMKLEISRELEDYTYSEIGDLFWNLDFSEEELELKFSKPRDFWNFAVFFNSVKKEIIVSESHVKQLVYLSFTYCSLEDYWATTGALLARHSYLCDHLAENDEELLNFAEELGVDTEEIYLEFPRKKDRRDELCQQILKAIYSLSWEDF